MTSKTQHLDYRPEIDGLRAVAVLGVLFFHIGIKCPGGYAGVDVFFVISGYLITALILRDIESGRFSLSQFWERRFRRILPALAVMVFVTLLVGGFLLLAEDYLKLGRSAAWQALFASNFYFWRDTGYFAAAADEKPLLHTWSLAVEEQFYLIVPLLLLAVMRWRSAGGRRRVIMILCALVLASLTWSVFVIHRDRAAAFFLLPARAWELLMGALLATFPAAWSLRLKRWREAPALLGLVGILFSYAAYDDNTLFPGLAALPAVLGAALIIWANQRTAGGAPPTWCGRCLAWRPVVFVGLISYSLYLWHWPLLAFINYWSFALLTKGEKLVVVLASLLLAVLSWRFIESPFRQRRIFGGQRPMLISGCATVLLLAVTGAGVAYFQGLPWRLPDGLMHGYERNSESSFMFVQQTTVEDLRVDKLASLGVPGPPGQSQAVLWGDSHAMAAVPAFDLVLREAGLSGCVITHPSTAPLLDFHAKVPNGPLIDTVALNQAVLEWIRQHHVRHVFLAAYWHVYELKGKVAGVPAQEYPAYYQQKILATVRALVKGGCQPWIMLQVPEHSQIVPKAHAYCHLFGVDESRFSARPDTWNGLAGTGPDFLHQVEQAGARIIDPRKAFLDAEGGYYRISMAGHALYADKHHLTRHGAEAMLVPVLRASLAPLLAPAKSLP